MPPNLQPFPIDELPQYSARQVRLLNALLSQFSNLDMKPLMRALSSVTQKYLGDAFAVTVADVRVHENDNSAADLVSSLRDRVWVQCSVPDLNQSLIASVSLHWAKSVVDRLLGGTGDLPGELSPLTALEQGVFEFFVLKLLQALRDNNPELPCSIWEYEGLLSGRSKSAASFSSLRTELRLKLKGKCHSTLLSLFFDGHALLRSLTAQSSRFSNDSPRYLTFCEHVKSVAEVELGKVYLSLDEQRALEEGDILLFDDAFSSFDNTTVSGWAKVRFDILPHWAFTATFDNALNNQRSGKYRLILNRFEEEHPYGT